MLTLVEASPGTTQRALARRMDFNDSAITATVARLETAGALSRRRHPQDGRVRVLSVTAEGRRALDQARPAFGTINSRIGGWSSRA